MIPGFGSVSGRSYNPCPSIGRRKQLKEEQKSRQEGSHHCHPITKECNRSLQAPEPQVHEYESKAVGPVKKGKRDEEKKVDLQQGMLQQSDHSRVSEDLWGDPSKSDSDTRDDHVNGQEKSGQRSSR